MDFDSLGARFWMIFEPQELVFGVPHRIGETCVRRFRLKTLLWWLGRRGADQSIDRPMDWLIDQQLDASIDRFFRCAQKAARVAWLCCSRRVRPAFYFPLTAPPRTPRPSMVRLINVSMTTKTTSRRRHRKKRKEAAMRKQSKAIRKQSESV